MRAGINESLRCPRCGSRISCAGAEYICRDPACAARFPVIEGIPILINEERSLFRIEDHVRPWEVFSPRRAALTARLNRILPSLGKNFAAAGNYRKFGTLVASRGEKAEVLIIGGGMQGVGVKSLAAHPGIRCTATDVSIGPRTEIVCDAHDIPFADETFDGVVIQAVLQFVADPARCVGEIHRVLRKDGLVYAETAFMQQAVAAPFDFTRFTLSGHRRLFRRFDRVADGAVGGPASALAWSINHFCCAFVRSAYAKYAITGSIRLLFFWLKFLDGYLLRHRENCDAAWALYFLGTKSANELTDREVVGEYSTRSH